MNHIVGLGGVRTLWLAVIELAISDYPYRCPKNYFYSEDFKEICKLADLEPLAVRRAMVQKGKVV